MGSWPASANARDLGRPRRTRRSELRLRPGREATFPGPRRGRPHRPLAHFRAPAAQPFCPVPRSKRAGRQRRPSSAAWRPVRRGESRRTDLLPIPPQLPNRPTCTRTVSARADARLRTIGISGNRCRTSRRLRPMNRKNARCQAPETSGSPAQVRHRHTSRASAPANGRRRRRRHGMHALRCHCRGGGTGRSGTSRGKASRCHPCVAGFRQSGPSGQPLSPVLARIPGPVRMLPQRSVPARRRLSPAGQASPQPRWPDGPAPMRQPRPPCRAVPQGLHPRGPRPAAAPLLDPSGGPRWRPEDSR